jgi:hypothetical protein
MWERKGGSEGVARVLYGQREGEGEAEAAGGLVIDGRRRCGIKKEGERGNGRIWRGNGRGDYGT